MDFARSSIPHRRGVCGLEAWMASGTEGGCFLVLDHASTVSLWQIRRDFRCYEGRCERHES